MNSLLRYPGGKFYMLEDIIGIINKSGKNAIIDVFSGSGKILLNINARIKVYNDINGNIVNFFNEVKHNKNNIIKKLSYAINSRELFNLYNEPTPDNTENAFRFLYRNILSFNGEGRNYSYSIKRNKSITLLNIDKALNKFYDDIKYWTIENLDYREIIKKYDSEDSFFYLDPPYHNIKDLYDYNLNDDDYIEIKKLLENIKGKYLLNINEDDFILNLFGEPNLRKEYTNFGVNGRNARKSNRVELFYYN